MTASKSDDRRGFLAKLLALSFGSIALAVPAAAALAAFLNPWRQKASQGTWVRAAALAALPDGKPERVPIIADRSDAWNNYPAEAIGAVFLCRNGSEVTAFQSICPHNGGGIGFDAAKDCFACPVHGARFNLKGDCLDKPSVSPRNMDTLDTKISDGEVWVKFEKFQDGTANKIVKS
jgi:nitrite reductase/ring-hydroxylating ferredoxin subunit